ncbi:MAG: N-acetyl sugar amidotransferase [bacterium]|nr:N-acetyl sugar amidotransferase [bacterium]
MSTPFQYCKKCVMPSTKPDLFFDEDGVCDACRSAELKNTIDWEARKKEFETDIVARYKGANKGNYDCIIPVSGGKDSHYQVYMAKKVYGLNPLLVSFESTTANTLGRKNRENIKTAFGCDLMVFEKNTHVYQKMCLRGFTEVGDNEWPNHLGIFTIPVRLAVALRIPLIIWGENSQLEYGGPKAARMKNALDRRWLEEFGGLLGLRIEDMVGYEGITEEDLVSYKYPSAEVLAEANVRGIFLGYYFKWDARPQVELVKKFGFSVKEDGPVEGTYTNYENLDEDLESVHDYLKFVKFGFGRATDHACLDVRNGRITRDEAVRLVEQYDGIYPWSGVKKFLAFSGMSQEAFDKVVDSFTDKSLFQTDEKGALLRSKEHSLVKKYREYGQGLGK